MEYKIVVDSCCDLTPQRREELGVVSVPLTMMLGEREFVDDDNLDINDFLDQMKQCTEKMGSAAPGPYLYQQAIEGAKDEAYVVTLSKHLSSSYANALNAKSMARESGFMNCSVIDSKSASAAQILIVEKLCDLISEGFSMEKITSAIHDFVDNIKTYFVLENYDNLQKNGRLGKITGKIIKILNIKLIMGSDGNGQIALFKKVRGVNQMITSMLQLIEDSGKKTIDQRLVITHCNNPDLAQRLCDEIKKRFNFKEVLIAHTRGLSTLYADNQGVIMAF